MATGIADGPIAVAVAWHHFDELALTVPGGADLYDMAGAPVDGPQLTLTESPMYVVSRTMSPDTLAAALME